jgi:hypothetical protein
MPFAAGAQHSLEERRTIAVELSRSENISQPGAHYMSL